MKKTVVSGLAAGAVALGLAVAGSAHADGSFHGLRAGIRRRRQQRRRDPVVSGVTTMRKTAKRLLVGTAIAVSSGFVMGTASAVLVPEAAHASPSVYSEDTGGFIHALRKDGFSVTYTDEDEALRMGHTVCRMLRGGDSEQEVITWLVDPPHPVPRLVAKAFVTDAHLYLCPGVGSDGYGPGTQT
jgi:Protein of unknown function (DUF732)